MLVSSRSSALRPSRALRGALLGLAMTAGLALAPLDASAVGTRSFDLSSYDDLSAGELAGVAVDSRGNLRAGWQLGKLAIDDAQTAWSHVVLADGTLLLGTGNEGKLVRVANGKAEVVAATGQMAVSAMTTAWGGDLILGSFPNGKLFRVKPSELKPLPAGKDAPKAEPPKEFAKLEGAEYVWALAFDEKSKSLYVATGPDGKVFRIDEQGKAQVHLDVEDPHVVSLALAADGKLYAGTSGKAKLYRVDAPGRAAIVHDFDGDDVAGIALAKDGTVWAIANKYGGFSLPGRGGGSQLPTPQSTRPSKAGEGVLVRVKNGVPEEMLASKKAHLTALALDDDGRPYVGTGTEGRVLTVDDDHFERLLADVDERQIAGLVLRGGRRLVIGSDPVVVRELRGEGGPEAVWTSKVLDAGLPATFGALQWRGEGTVEVEARTGNTQEPDATWSAWSPALTATGKLKADKGRYVQLRARFARDPKASLRELKLHFVTDNARAYLTNVTADSRVQKSGRLQMGLAGSGGKAPKASTQVNLKWEVENPDKDDLRYRVSYRLEGQSMWRDALKPAEILTKTDLDWDTTSLPEGLYRVRVEATDELVNPPDRVTRHTLESGLVLVDNTAPRFQSIALDGRRLKAEVQDGLGPIVRFELALAGTDDWRPLFPTDSVFDDATERFDADVSALVPAGSRIVGVRAYDAAGNVVTKELEAK